MDRDSVNGRGSPSQQLHKHAAQQARGGDAGGWNGAWGNAQHSDTAPMYDNHARGGKAQHQKGNHPGRRAKNYRKLWEHVKSVHAGDTEGGRHMPSEMSVEELVRVCCTLPPDTSAVTAVSAALVYLDSRAMAAFMKELAKSQQLNRAMEVFDWLKSLPQEHELYPLADVYTFTTAISLMGPSQQLRRALELVGEMRARGLQCNVHTYSALMNVCIKCDACDLALDVFKQMHEDRIRPNVVTYNTLVDVYGKTGQWEKAVRVLDDMRDEDLEPEVRTFNTAIIACNMCGQPQEALKVYQKLLDAGLQPISTTYTALISAFGKAGQLDKAMETFQTMIQQGCERSVITYSALISACEKAGRWELALELFDQMQHEGCTPNTVTYNSLITACQQGGQAAKACEVFEQMKYNGCRPDVVTYSGLISAYHKSGQWHKALRAFEQMQQQHNCKPDSYVYQTVIDSLWETGIAWAQLRAWQLYAMAARNWQYRFTVQQANSSNPTETEYVVPAFTPGVAVLALRKWVGDLVGQVESDSTLLGATRERMVLSLGRSKHVKEPSSSAACQALLSVLAGIKSPFRPADGTVTAAGNVVVAEADMFAALAWLRSADLPELLALLVPFSASSGRQPSPFGPNQKRISFGAELSDDSKLEDSCQRAYNTVLEFELVQVVQPQGMVDEYVSERKGLVHTAFQLAAQLDLAEEVVFDAVLLMDRVMSTGTAHDSNLGNLFVAASLRLAALQTVSGSDSQAASSIPSDELLTAAVAFPPGSVSKMEENIKAALSSDTKSISMLRTLKLYLERMGADKQDVPAATHFHSGIFRLLRSVLLDPNMLHWRPAVLAAAVLVAARQAVGCHPFLPSCLAQLTSMSQDTPELAAAVAAIEPLAATAGLVPPARASPVGQYGRPLSSGQLFSNGGTPSYNGSHSGYSTPSHAGTPTAAAAAAMAAQMQFSMPQKSLLEAVVRQHGGLHRAGSDMSSLSAQTCSDAGSAADLQALLTGSAFLPGAPGSGPLSHSPLLPGSASEPFLAAAMAGLQLGMMQQGMGGLPAVPQMPWLGGAGAGGYDAFRGGGFGPQQAQHQSGSRLQQMTTPYVMPNPMQAYMQHSVGHMQR